VIGTMGASSVRYKLYGVLALLLIAAAVAAILGNYNGAFTPVVAATVRADRSGLLLDPGADVTLLGVTVGKVRAVSPDGDAATIEVALDPALVDEIPANVTANLLAPTIFGAKFLDLVVPARSSPQHIADGAVIQPTTVGPEINNVFEDLVSLLSSIDPAKLNSALGALSTGLQGRGKQLGDTMEQLNAYLADLQPSVPAMSSDISGVADVANVYADATPDLLATTGNVTATSRTLVQKETQLAAFLLDLTGVADTARGFLADNEGGLHDSLATLAPVTALLARYSPETTCLLAAANQVRPPLEQLMGGAQPGLHLLSSFLPGQEPYRYPRDLPKVAADDGPSCYGGPLAPGASPSPYVKFDDGSHPFDSSSDGVSVGHTPLAVQLFGPAAANGGR
jgi:phospholipid/cholesterol/gamma-HCH transport system substrate-binding protein